MLEQSPQQILIFISHFISQGVFDVKKINFITSWIFTSRGAAIFRGDQAWLAVEPDRSVIANGSANFRSAVRFDFKCSLRLSHAARRPPIDRDVTQRNANEAGMRAAARTLEKSRRIVETPLDRVSRLIG